MGMILVVWSNANDSFQKVNLASVSEMHSG